MNFQTLGNNCDMTMHQNCNTHNPHSNTVNYIILETTQFKEGFQKSQDYIDIIYLFFFEYNDFV